MVLQNCLKELIKLEAMFLMGKELDWFDIFVIAMVVFLIKLAIEKIFVVEIDSLYGGGLICFIVILWDRHLRNK